MLKRGTKDSEHQSEKGQGSGQVGPYAIGCLRESVELTSEETHQQSRKLGSVVSEGCPVGLNPHTFH